MKSFCLLFLCIWLTQAEENQSCTNWNQSDLAKVQQIGDQILVSAMMMSDAKTDSKVSKETTFFARSAAVENKSDATIFIVAGVVILILIGSNLRMAIHLMQQENSANLYNFKKIASPRTDSGDDILPKEANSRIPSSYIPGPLPNIRQAQSMFNNLSRERKLELFQLYFPFIKPFCLSILAYIHYRCTLDLGLPWKSMYNLVWSLIGFSFLVLGEKLGYAADDFLKHTTQCAYYFDTPHDHVQRSQTHGHLFRREQANHFRSESIDQMHDEMQQQILRLQNERHRVKDSYRRMSMRSNDLNSGDVSVRSRARRDALYSWDHAEFENPSGDAEREVDLSNLDPRSPDFSFLIDSSDLPWLGPEDAETSRAPHSFQKDIEPNVVHKILGIPLLITLISLWKTFFTIEMNVWTFLKYCLMRFLWGFIYDLLFTIGHALLHTKAVYPWHKEHHSSRYTGYHEENRFSLLDYFIEIPATFAAAWVVVIILCGGMPSYCVSLTIIHGAFFRKTTVHTTHDQNCDSRFTDLFLIDGLLGFPPIARDHAVHHYDQNANIGVFCLWDRIWGTYRPLEHYQVERKKKMCTE